MSRRSSTHSRLVAHILNTKARKEGGNLMDMLDMPDRRTGASPVALKTTILSYLYVIREQWFIKRRTQHGLIYAKFGSESTVL